MQKDSASESFMPLSGDFVANIEPDDRFILGFPRSGTRWLRWVLSDLILQSLGIEPDWLYDGKKPRGPFDFRTNSFDPDPRRIVVNAHEPHPEGSSLPAIGLPRLFRAHHLDEVLRRRNRSVFIFRWPPAMLVSYYYFVNKTHPHPSGQAGWELFCKAAANLWKAHTQKAISACHGPDSPCLILRYGDDRPLKIQQVQVCAKHFNIDSDPSRIHKALDRLNAHLDQEREEDHGHPRGSNEGARRIMAPDLLNWVESETGELYRAASELAASRLGDCEAD